MRYKRNASSILAILLATLMVAASFASAFATSESEKRQEAEKAGKKAEEMYAKVEEAGKKIEELQARIDETSAKVEKTRAQLEKKKKEVEEQEGNLDARLRTMYKTGTVGLVDVILSSDNINELITNYSMVQRILDNDKDLLKKLEADYKEIEKLEKELESEQASLEADKAEVEEIRAQYKAQAKEFEEQQKQLEREADALAAEAARKQAEAEAKLRQQQGKSGSGSSSLPASGFMFPLKSHYGMTSGFGYRTHPVYGYTLYHSGWDYAADTGTPIYAIADGYVTLASWNGGYGNCIIISVGGGYSALFGHLSSYAVSAGQYVKKGQVVGYVGSTGVSTGPHLHYSVLLNGAYVEPSVLTPAQ
jgi:murein DD-endopeptidase MepM/ murein hydrolase activator NlpD